MATHRDILTYLRQHSHFKTERTLTNRRRVALLRKRPAPARRLVPTRAVPLELMYPKKGLLGGLMIPIRLRDGRKGRLDEIVEVEMRWVEGHGWYPCDYKLTMRAAAAVCGVALSTFYRIADDLESKKRIFSRVFFWTHTLFEADIERVDELAARVERKRGGRPGAHAEYCAGPPNHRLACPHAENCMADAKHAGTCDDPRRRRRRPKPSSRWSAHPKRQTISVRCADDSLTPLEASDPDRSGLMCQTWTEALINETTTNPDDRAALYDEQEAEIRAERRAGHFVPRGREVE